MTGVPAVKVPLLGRGGFCTHLSRAFTVQICAAASAHQPVQARCSQGPSMIPPRNALTGTPVSTLLAPVNLSCFCAESKRLVSCLADVVMDVDGQGHRYSAASKKSCRHCERLGGRHIGMHIETILIPFGKLSRTCVDLSPIICLLHVFWPCMLFRCGFRTASI